MEATTSVPGAIKLMMTLVFIDVTAMILYNYLDTLNDPDIDFLSFDNLITFLFPLAYLAGMIWCIKSHASFTKIIFYIVLAVEVAAFSFIDFESTGFDLYFILSLISIVALLGCIYLVHTEAGKAWFVVKKDS